MSYRSKGGYSRLVTHSFCHCMICLVAASLALRYFISCYIILLALALCLVSPEIVENRYLGPSFWALLVRSSLAPRTSIGATSSATTTTNTVFFVGNEYDAGIVDPERYCYQRKPWANIGKHQMFLNLLRNIFASQEANFVSATMFSRVGKQGNI